jgi:lysophospholipase L1-like esterase
VWLLSFCSENSIRFIDFYGLFEERLKSLSEKDLYIDGLHPRKLGHELMAGEFARALQ